MSPFSDQETIAYHAARLLILIDVCGKPQTGARLPAVVGRTLLAKLDFFIRYPAYLWRAGDVLDTPLTQEELGLADSSDLMSTESRMVRYKYGPWDHIYYTVLAYLIGKGLIEVEVDRRSGIETFRITSSGRRVAHQLKEEIAFGDLNSRARTAYKLFNKYTGNRLKEFIYLNFPEVVNRKLGERI